MPSALPAALIFCWALFFASFLAQGHHERALKSSPFFESQALLRAVEISTLLALIAGLGTIGYYFSRVSWYWPIVLAIGGSMLGALVMGLLSGLFGVSVLSKLGFLGWPLCCFFSLKIIHGLG